MGTKEQMLRVTTRRVIAGVANDQRCRVFLVMDKVGYPTGNKLLAAADLEYSVALSISRALPFMAAAAIIIDARKKPVDQA